MDPGLDPLLHTNHPPSDHQARKIYGFLELETKTLSEIEVSLLKLRLVISNLEYQQQRLEKSIATWKRVISPVRSLPPEILAEIFLRCRQNSAASITDARYICHTREAPIVLTHISSRWRSISLSIPHLW
ncbi:hypothetical protein DFH06DRAFT_1008774, partial [Mycena polygramma]